MRAQPGTSRPAAARTRRLATECRIRQVLEQHISGAGHVNPGRRLRSAPEPPASSAGLARLLVESCRASIQADHRVRRNAVQRLADSEERQDGPGRDRSRRANGDRTQGLRAVRIGPNRCRRPRARRRSRTSTSAPALPPDTLRRRLNDELPADINILSAVGRAASLSRAARRRGAPVSLSDRHAPHGVREAVRLVGQGAARPGAHARGRAGLRRHARLHVVRRRRSGRGRGRIDARAARATRSRGRRRADPRRDRRDRISSGGWCDGSSASSSRSAGRAGAAAAAACSTSVRTFRRASRRRRRDCFSSASSMAQTLDDTASGR